MNVPGFNNDPLLTPAEVAALLRVDPKTVTRWAQSGRLYSIRTIGGHRRYRQSDIRAILDGTAKRQDRLNGGEQRG